MKVGSHAFACFSAWCLRTLSDANWSTSSIVPSDIPSRPVTLQAGQLHFAEKPGYLCSVSIVYLMPSRASSTAISMAEQLVDTKDRPSSMRSARTIGAALYRNQQMQG